MDNVIAFDPLARVRRTGGRRPDGDVLTVPETASLLGLSRNTTYTYLADGTIPGRRVGRRWVVSRSALEAWLTSAATGGGR